MLVLEVTRMKIQGATLLVTGANRGLGRSLVLAALAAGAQRVYATARDPKLLEPLAKQSGDRIVPLALDVTDARSIEAAAARATDVSLLVNNAGTLASYGVLDSSPADLGLDFATNLFGLLATTKAFVPALTRSGGAAVVNILSVVSLASIPALGGYSASKAAAFSVTQALRAELAAKQITVHAVLPGTIDTDMVRSFGGPKTSPDDVAKEIFAGVERGEEEILPDPLSREFVGTWSRDAKALERTFASFDPRG
jgi:NAD(P)-dependent dehydrogenase (short-subunit alcohol dehydrogenase family)